MSDEGLGQCPSCQAPRGPGDVYCWMCQRPWNEAPGSAKPTHELTTASVPPPRATSGGRWTLPTLIVALVLVLVGFGTGTGPGMALGGLVGGLALIVAMFMAAIAGLRPPKTTPRTFVEKVERALVVASSLLALAIVAGIAVIVALFAVCVAILAAVSH